MQDRRSMRPQRRGKRTFMYEGCSMKKSAGTKAEEQFSAAKKKSQKVLKDREKSRQTRAEQTARLRALRLAKEVTD
jgi:hypothetical protein